MLPVLNSVQAQEAPIDPEIRDIYSEALTYMDNGDYDQANRSFRKILSMNKVLPTDLSYYFAETLFQLGQFQNSKNFVDKYLSLSDAGDDHYEEAISLRDDLNKEFNAIKECMYCNVFGYRYIECDQCNDQGNLTSICPSCKGNGLTICLKCYGKGVVVTRDAFNQEKYDTCDRCNGNGYEECAVCKGEAQIEQVCNYCLGSKQRTSNIICDHTAPDNEHEAHKIPERKF